MPPAEGFGQGLRVGLYARVSSSHQQTIGAQLDALRAYAARRGWHVVLERSETGSGADVGRPARAELRRAALRRELDAVLVWRLDRWGRSLADLVTSLHELGELGVAFVSLMEGFDLTTAGGRALAGILGVFAEFERELRRERVALGIERARREGKHLGRPRSVSLATERRVRELVGTKSRAAISRELGVPRTTVRRILAKER